MTKTVDARQKAQCGWTPCEHFLTQQMPDFDQKTAALLIVHSPNIFHIEICQVLGNESQL